MRDRQIIIDMTPDGEFRDPPRAHRPMGAKLQRWALLTAVVAGALTVAALALVSLAVLIPLTAGAAAIAWATQRWRGLRT